MSFVFPRDHTLSVYYIKVCLQVCYKSIVYLRLHCAAPENIHTHPIEGIGISWGVGGSVRPKI